jgi:hypothetical protein
VRVKSTHDNSYRATAVRDIFIQLGIERSKVTRILRGGSSLDHSFAIDAEDFLQQAEDDYDLGGNSALLNAVSNAKRAIHAQIDAVLSALGYNISNRGIERKMVLFGELGFVTPRILKRVNDARNILEHEYAMPTMEQVQEAIDLATLFVNATRRHTVLWEHEILIGNRDLQFEDSTFSRVLSISFQHDDKLLQLVGEIDALPFYEKLDRIEQGNYTGREIGSITLSAQDILFKDFIRLIVANDRQRKAQEALEHIFDQLDL